MKSTLLYICHEDMSDQASGVVKKIQDQIKAFKSLGFRVMYTHIIGKVYFLNDGVNDIRLCRTVKPIQLGSMKLSCYLTKELKNYTVDFFYVRGANYFLRYRSFRQNGKVIIEIPTLNAHEDRGWRKLKKFLFYPFKLAAMKQIDAYVNFENVDEINGIKAFPLTNCVDIDRFRVHKRVREENDSSINMIAVALMAYWQGYERIIQSMGEYKRQFGPQGRKFHLFLVGDGPEIPLYKSLVKEYELNDDVTFCGKLSGETLDDLFDKADLALGCFGSFKKNCFLVSALKIKEYFARAIPMVCACKDSALLRDEKFYLMFPNDLSLIDMKLIASFYDSVGQDSSIPKRMRDLCEKKFNWTCEYRRFFNEAFSLNLD